MMSTYLYKEQDYSNSSVAERTTDHTNVKILIVSNKVEVVSQPKKPQHTKKENI